MSLAKDLIDRLEGMKSERHNWDNIVQRCYDFVDPTDGHVARKPVAGETRHDRIFDHTALESYETFVSGMASNITPLDAPFVDVVDQDEELNKREEVIRFYDELTKRMAVEIAVSNFDLESLQLYAALGIPGRSVIFAFEDIVSDRLFYKTVHYTNSYIAESNRKTVDTVFMDFTLTARQAVQEYGDDVSEKIGKASLDPKKANTKFAFIQAVFPRTDRDLDKRTREHMPYASIHLERDNMHIVKNSGFHEQPFAAPRYDKGSTDVEGVSPAMKALSSILSINKMSLDMMDLANRDAAPVILTPDPEIMFTDTADGRQLVYNPKIGKPEYLNSGSNYQLPEFMVNRKEQSIKKAFLVDFFAMLSSLDSTTPRTMFEINARLKESVDLRHVMRGRIKTEFLDPLMNRTVNLLFRMGKLPPVPDILRRSRGFKFEYRGPLAILAKSLQNQNDARFVQNVIELSESFPSVKTKIDADKLVSAMTDNFNASGITRTDEEVRQIRQAESQQADEERQILLASEAAKAVPSLQKKTERGSPVDLLTSQR